jgi:hypothetical protein
MVRPNATFIVDFTFRMAEKPRYKTSQSKVLLNMKKFALLMMLLVVVMGVSFGCSKDPGVGAPATPEEVQNDPAVNEPGGV